MLHFGVARCCDDQSRKISHSNIERSIYNPHCSSTHIDNLCSIVLSKTECQNSRVTTNAIPRSDVYVHQSCTWIDTSDTKSIIGLCSRNPSHIGPMISYRSSLTTRICTISSSAASSSIDTCICKTTRPIPYLIDKVCMCIIKSHIQYCNSGTRSIWIAITRSDIYCFQSTNICS